MFRSATRRPAGGKLHALRRTPPPASRRSPEDRGGRGCRPFARAGGEPRIDGVQNFGRSYRRSPGAPAPPASGRWMWRSNIIYRVMAGPEVGEGRITVDAG